MFSLAESKGNNTVKNDLITQQGKINQESSLSGHQKSKYSVDTTTCTIQKQSSVCIEI